MRSGSVSESVYDAAGNVVATLRFAARPTLTEYTETAINAAVNRDDADNQVTRSAYDVLNRLRYTVDALGSVSEKAYDARGNIVKTVRWATRPTLTQYSERAIAAALAAMPAADNDDVTRFVYDAGNRLRFTIDALGSVSENSYDALGNVVAATRFAARPTGDWPAGFGNGGIDAALYSRSKTYFFAGTLYIRVTRGDTETGTLDKLSDISAFRWPAGFGTDGIDAALYSGSKTYYFAGTRYLRVTRRTDTGTGTLDPGYPADISAWGWPAGFGTDGIDAALSVGSKTYFFAGTRYLRVTRSGDTETGTLDPGYPADISAWGWPAGFGTDGIDAALYSGSKTYFFAGTRYIRVTRSDDTETGTLDPGYPADISAWGWPAGFRTDGIDAFTEAAVSAAVEPLRNNPDNQVTRFAYDADQRLRFTVDALGSVSESVYDPAGQLVSSVQYATRPMLTAFTESAINAALNRADTSNQVSHSAYDAAGRRCYSVRVLASDATGKPTQQLVSEQAYDSLGRVVQTIAYATLLGPVADYTAATLASAITAGAQDRRSASVYDAAEGL